MRDWMQSQWWGAYRSGTFMGRCGSRLNYRSGTLSNCHRGCGARMLDAAYLYGFRAGVRERNTAPEQSKR